MPSALQWQLHTQNKPLEQRSNWLNTLLPLSSNGALLLLLLSNLKPNQMCHFFPAAINCFCLSYSICRLPSHMSQEIIHVFSQWRSSSISQLRRQTELWPLLGLSHIIPICDPGFNSDGWFGHEIYFNVNWKTAPFLQEPLEPFFFSLKIPVFGIPYQDPIHPYGESWNVHNFTI